MQHYRPTAVTLTLWEQLPTTPFLGIYLRTVDLWQPDQWVGRSSSSARLPASLVTDHPNHVGCPSGRGYSVGLFLSKPTSAKTRPAKPFDDGTAFADRFPNQLRGVVFDHKNDRALIQAEDPRRYPAIRVPVFFRIGRIETGVESVGTALFQIQALYGVTESLHDNLGRERKRSRDCPGRDRTIIRPKRSASRDISVEFSTYAVQMRTAGPGPSLAVNPQPCLE